MKFYLLQFIASCILESCYSDTEIHGKYFGRGVCSVSLRDNKTVSVNEIHFHNETTWELCWHFPPWCTVVDIPHKHLKLECCPGYRSNANATACIPICSPLCIKGYCSDVDTCFSCQPGYAGSKCDRKLEVISTRSHESVLLKEKFSSPCECPDDNFVCAPNGTCICAPGFNGTDCTTIIEPAAFITDPGAKPSCVSSYLQVVSLLCLLVLSSFVIIYYIKRHFNLVRFEPLTDYSQPSTSRSRAH